MSCPKCGHEINSDHFPLGLIYCPYCGDKIGEQEPFQIIPFCLNCGHRLLTSVTFCPECGKRIAPEPVPAPVNETAAPETAPACETIKPKEAEAAAPVKGRVRPSRQARPKQPARPFGPVIKAAFQRVYGPVENFFTGRWRLKRLYRDWSQHDALPQEEIPADHSLKNIVDTTVTPERRPVPVWMAVLSGAGVIAFFEAVGIYIRLSSIR